MQRARSPQPKFGRSSVPLSAPPPAKSPAQKRSATVRFALLHLLGLGLLLELISLALYPLLAATKANDPLPQLFQSLFPWQARLDWTTRWPVLPRLLGHIHWLDLAQGDASSAHLLLILLLLASGATLLATAVGRRLAQQYLSRRETQLAYWLVLLLTALFGLTLLVTPITNGKFVQETLLYSLYGRLVTMYGANPYLVAPSAIPQDALQILVSRSGTPGIAECGPVWIDVSILVALFAHNSIAHMMLGFRLIGLVAHVGSTALLWAILSKAKPTLRLSAMLFYGWNPLVLLFSIPLMQQEVILVFLLLLAVRFFQNDSPTVAWFLALLAALINPFCLLLLPLFLRLMIRKAHFLQGEQRFFWWLGITTITILSGALAYLPYWRGWSLSGIGTNIATSFWQKQSINSLNTALLNLPIHLPTKLLWLLAAQNWSLLALMTLGSVLLFGLWFADTLELTLLVGSWLFLVAVLLQPIYWPWYVLLPLALAQCAAHRGTIILSWLLMLGALASYYCWQQNPVWPGQGLVTTGLPLLMWGWMLFILSLRYLTRATHSA